MGLSKFEYEIDIVRMIREFRFMRHFVKYKMSLLNESTKAKITKGSRFRMINLRRGGIKSGVHEVIDSLESSEEQSPATPVPLSTILNLNSEAQSAPRFESEGSN